MKSINCIPIIIALMLILGVSHNAYSENRPQKVNACQFLLSSVGMSSYLIAFAEIISVPMSIKNKLLDKCRTHKKYQCKTDIEFETLSEMQEWAIQNNSLIDENLIGKSASQKQYRLAKYGSILIGKTEAYSEDEFRNHFSENIPEAYRSIGVNAFDEMLNHGQIQEWVSDLRSSVLKHMWDDGVRRKAQYSNPYLTAEYLDFELARRAKNQGFSINSSGKPWGLYTVNQLFFSFNLAMGRLFVDWTGPELQGSEDKNLHGARGHILQLVYLAEHVEGISDLIKFIGMTNDYHGMWTYLFDNTYNTDSPFWTGFWIRAFGNYLNIPY